MAWSPTSGCGASFWGLVSGGQWGRGGDGEGEKRGEGGVRREEGGGSRGSCVHRCDRREEWRIEKAKRGEGSCVMTINTQFVAVGEVGETELGVWLLRLLVYLVKECPPNSLSPCTGELIVHQLILFIPVQLLPELKFPKCRRKKRGPASLAGEEAPEDTDDDIDGDEVEGRSRARVLWIRNLTRIQRQVRG